MGFSCLCTAQELFLLNGVVLIIKGFAVRKKLEVTKVGFLVWLFTSWTTSSTELNLWDSTRSAIKWGHQHSPEHSTAGFNEVMCRGAKIMPGSHHYHYYYYCYYCYPHRWPTQQTSLASPRIPHLLVTFSYAPQSWFHGLCWHAELPTSGTTT